MTIPSSISTVSNERHIAMTFDDGPHGVNTPRLLEMAVQRQIKLTFFVVGECVERNQEILRCAVNDGHEIGNHSWSHPNLAKLGPDEIRGELLRTDQIIQRTSGVKPRLMRPPYGELTQDQREWIQSEFGYHVVFWNVDPQDWQRPGAQIVGSRILSAVQPKCIVLSHDNIALTIDAMPYVFDALLRLGYNFLTVSELLMEKGKCICEPKKEADR